MIFEIQGMETPITAKRWEHKRKEVTEVPLRNSKWTRPPREELQEEAKGMEAQEAQKDKGAKEG